MKEFIDRVVLVTGANRGIGLEVAGQFDQRGSKTILGARDVQKRDEGGREVAAMPDARRGTHDLNDDEQIRSEFSAILELDHGRDGTKHWLNAGADGASAERIREDL